MEDEKQLLEDEESLIMVDFDQVLDKIGLGLFQIRIFIALFILGISEAAQIQIYSLTLVITQKELNISQQLQDIQSSLFFGAVLLGSIFSGYFSDKIGRTKACLLGSILLSLFQSAISISQNSSQLIFLRVVSSFILGFFAPLVITIMTEIIPTKIRGRLMILLGLSFSIGQLFGVYLTSIILDKELDSGNWRLLNFISAFPLFISVLIQLLYLHESPRYLFMKKQFKSALKIINHMAMVNCNKTYELLDVGESKQLIQWAKYQQANEDDQYLIQKLFSKQYFMVTIILWNNWLALSFCYYGIILYLPIILKSLNQTQNLKFDVMRIVNALIFEIFGQIIGFFIIDKKYFGRKNSIILLFLFTSISSFLAYQQKIYFIVYSTISKILVQNIMVFCFQYTSEIYTTKLRAFGVGMANGIGKLSGVFIPLVCGTLERYDVASSYTVFSCLCLISSVVTILLPCDTTGVPLDQILQK